jgi:hypothetical protein
MILQKHCASGLHPTEKIRLTVVGRVVISPFSLMRISAGASGREPQCGQVRGGVLITDGAVIPDPMRFIGTLAAVRRSTAMNARIQSPPGL